MAEQELCMERLLNSSSNGYSDHYVPDGFVMRLGGIQGGLFMLEHFFKSLVAIVSDP